MGSTGLARDHLHDMPTEILKEFMKYGHNEAVFRVDASDGVVAFKAPDVWNWGQLSQRLRGIASDRKLWTAVRVDCPFHEPTSGPFEVNRSGYARILSLFKNVLEKTQEEPLDVTINLQLYFGQRGRSESARTLSLFLQHLRDRNNEWRSLSIMGTRYDQATLDWIGPFHRKLHSLVSLRVEFLANEVPTLTTFLNHFRDSHLLMALEIWPGSDLDAMPPGNEELIRPIPWTNLDRDELFTSLSPSADLSFPLSTITTLRLACSDASIISILPLCPAVSTVWLSLVERAAARRGMPNLKSLALVLTEPEPWVANLLDVLECARLHVFCVSLPIWTWKAARLRQPTIAAIDGFLEREGGTLKEVAIFPSPGDGFGEMVTKRMPECIVTIGESVFPGNWDKVWAERLVGWLPADVKDDLHLKY
ncbi:hypothetical protein V5O48_008467 [Marasmius crinis-equi]|uniref:Uncharacterized protein n=1 Tax=Marasmius crinis-equi TaxID=585013 RepID=A0ABR3FED1_9AGAR